LAKFIANISQYTEEAFRSEMIESTIPEIQRQNLESVILTLKALGLNDLIGFDFLDPPPVSSMLEAMSSLYALSALDESGLLTVLGRKLAAMPMAPSLAKVLVASVELGCSDEMLSIVAMLSVQNVFYRPRDKQQQADQKKSKFHDPHGDHETLLRVYQEWVQSGYSASWCQEMFIQNRTLKRARDVRNQLVDILKRHRLRIVSCGRNTDQIRKALCTGYFRNSARKDPQEGYKTLENGTPVYMHPSSALFGGNKGPAEFVIYHSLVLTTKEYMTQVSAIDPRWLVEGAPNFFKVAPTDRLSKRKKAERIQPLHNKFAGEDDWRLSAQKRQGRGGGGGTWG
jgi:ATP-dependent RNA helicase DHX8/PRP22